MIDFRDIRPENHLLYKEIESCAKSKFGPDYTDIKNLWILNKYKEKGGLFQYDGIVEDSKWPTIFSDMMLSSFVESTTRNLVVSNQITNAERDEIVSDFYNLAGMDISQQLEYLSSNWSTDQGVRAKEKKTLNKPFRLPAGSTKKFGVYVKKPDGSIVKVTFGDPNMEIKRDNPKRRKSFRARHNCDNPGPKWKARYWSCYQWRDSSKVVSEADLLATFPDLSMAMVSPDEDKNED